MDNVIKLRFTVIPSQCKHWRGDDMLCGQQLFHQVRTQQLFGGDPQSLALLARSGIIAQFLRSVSGRWYKPDYAEIIPLVWNNGEFSVPETEIQP